jgi:predicted nucleotidyltransferase/plasmid maintenance system antidote protein VapI
MNLFKTENFGEVIRRLRKGKGQPLRTVAAYLDIDQAILSKIERGQRKATREQVVKLAGYFKVDKEHLLVSWLSDKLLNELKDEEVALQALQVAEEKVEYISFLKTDRNKIIRSIRKTFRLFPIIEKAWIYGSFSRKEDMPKSDIDIAVKTGKKFTYFDLAEVQYELERTIGRKIDIGFIDSFKPNIWKNVKPDLKLVYEKKYIQGKY